MRAPNAKLIEKTSLLREYFKNMTLLYLYRFMGIFCIIIHTFFFLLFLYLNILPLILLNVVSVGIYTYCIFFILKGVYRTVTIFAYIEIIFQAFFSTYIIGWDYGFYLFIISIIPLGYYCPFKTTIPSVMTSFFSFIAFIFIWYFSQNNEPLYVTDDAYRNFIFLANALICFIVLSSFSYLYSASTKVTQTRLAEKNKNLQVLANTDPLTGLLNRRSMFNELESAIYKKNFAGQNFVVILADIDDFKSTNDNYGHDSGDYVLKDISNLIKTTIRENDIVCRWGGEEILILLSNTDLSTGKIIAEEIRQTIENRIISHRNKNIQITITQGLCDSVEDITVDELINLADKNLYEGKSKGKNCVVAH